jgi:amino acid permease
MTGTGVLTVPWAFQQSGIALGIALTFVAFAFSTYTCYLVIKTAGGDLDYTETIKKQFGKKGWTISMTIFIVTLYVPILLFQQLLSQSLFPIILALAEPFTHTQKQISF